MGKACYTGCTEIKLGKGMSMTRRQKDPLRALTQDEQQWLERISRSHSDPASHVARAKALLAVAAGASFTKAAQLAGRRSNDAVAALVARFNREGLAAIAPRHGGGQKPKYSPAQRQRIVEYVGQQPDREADGTVTWSLTTLRDSLRSAPDGLPTLSTGTIHSVLHEAGYTWQRSRSWCTSGTSLRRRKRGVVEVVDPDAEAKKD
jgi:transposase